MTDSLAQVDTARITERPAVVRIVGEVDMSNADTIAAQLDAAADGVDALTIDLTDVAYLDSHGLHILQSLADRHTVGSLKLTLIADPGGIAHQLLTIAGIANTVPVCGFRRAESCSSE